MDSNGQKVTKCFAYPEIVDSNYHDRLSPISLEETWKTTRWPC